MRSKRHERLKLAAGRRLPKPQLMKLLGIRSSTHLNAWISSVSLMPWVTVERGKDGILISVNEELREICDVRRSLPTMGGISYIAFLANMRREITRRRKENHDERMKRNWNPEGVVKRFQTELLDWIEQQLDLLTTAAKQHSCPRLANRPHSGKGVANVLSENERNRSSIDA